MIHALWFIFSWYEWTCSERSFSMICFIFIKDVNSRVSFSLLRRISHDRRPQKICSKNSFCCSVVRISFKANKYFSASKQAGLSIIILTLVSSHLILSLSVGEHLLAVSNGDPAFLIQSLKSKASLLSEPLILLMVVQKSEKRINILKRLGLLVLAFLPGVLL